MAAESRFKEAVYYYLMPVWNWKCYAVRMAVSGRASRMPSNTATGSWHYWKCAPNCGRPGGVNGGVKVHQWGGVKMGNYPTYLTFVIPITISLS